MIRRPLTNLLVATGCRPCLDPVLNTLGGLRSIGCCTLTGISQVLSVRPLNRLPAIRRVLLPLPVLATIDAAVATGIDVATLAADDEAFVAFRVAPAQTAGTACCSAAYTCEFSAVLDCNAAPGTVDILPAARDHGVAGPWIVGGDEAPFAARS